MPPLRVGFDALALAVGLLVLMRGYDRPWVYPFPGSPDSVHVLDRELRAGDVALITNEVVYTYAIHTETGLEVVPTPDRQIGFTFDFVDPRIYSIGGFGELAMTAEAIDPVIDEADRVLVLQSGSFGSLTSPVTASIFEGQGFALEDAVQPEPGADVIEIWVR